MSAPFAEIGARVRQSRIDAGLTQNELAAKCELSRTSITNIEKGIQNVQIGTIRDIALACAVSPGWLAFGDAPLVSDESKRIAELEAALSVLEQRNLGAATKLWGVLENVEVAASQLGMRLEWSDQEGKDRVARKIAKSKAIEAHKIAAYQPMREALRKLAWGQFSVSGDAIEIAREVIAKVDASEGS